VRLSIETIPPKKPEKRSTGFRGDACIRGINVFVFSFVGRADAVDDSATIVIARPFHAKHKQPFPGKLFKQMRLPK